MEEEISYEEISMEYHDNRIRILIDDPILMAFYHQNPKRVERFLKAYLSMAIGDIALPSSLDSLTATINLKAIEEKRKLEALGFGTGKEGSSVN
ncbi:MAG TPA: hypothetical protein VMC07_01520 [Candidatus Omnitrophota bacterium]|nr:hypothetical protein [Candidatus Omnitrophota bacterium]